MSEELIYTEDQMKGRIKAEKAATRTSTIIWLLVIFLLLSCVCPVLCSVAFGLFTAVVGL